MCAWKAILDRSLRAEACRVVTEIAHDVSRFPRPVDESAGRSSLGRGAAGEALFYQYLDATGIDAGLPRETARELLEQAVRDQSRAERRLELFSGFTGIAWTVGHLSGAVSDSFDATIAAAAATWSDERPYDLIGGIIGNAVYALARLPADLARECLRGVVRRLAETACETPAGTTWFTPRHLIPARQRAEFPDGYYNLGVAHGVPGVIAVLAQTHAAGIAVDDCGRLLEGAVAWLVAQRLPATGSTCAFPFHCSPVARSRPARSAWCYGDPGIAGALLVAALSVGRPDWMELALDVARCCASLSLADSGVVDAGFCHGAAGLAHIYNRLHQATGDRACLDAARTWFARLLEMRDPGTPVSGFPSWQGDSPDPEPWKPEPGLLFGAAGVGLSLLGAISDVEPEWDQVLLLSPALAGARS